MSLPKPYNEKDKITVLSLGAGVQSSTLALMATKKEISPMPAFAIFADTQDESDATYRWLNWLEKNISFPIIRVTVGKLSFNSLIVKKSKNNTNYTQSSIPAFIKSPSGKVGVLMRHCTTNFKIIPIYRALNKIRKGRKVSQWLGISRDEATRMKPSRKNWCVNLYPLVDLNITRMDCVKWLAKNGFPSPPRSACIFCPFHNDVEWKNLKEEAPFEFKKVAEYEKALQNSMLHVTNFYGVPYLHRSCVPISEVDFRPNDIKIGQLNMFENECEGMCGV